MKVFIGKNGVSGKAFNNKAKISHEVAPKDTLSKRSGGVISNKYVRTVGGNTEKQRDVPNAAAQARHSGTNYARSVRTETKSNVVDTEKTVIGNPEMPRGSSSVAAQKREHFGNDAHSENKPLQPATQKEARFVTNSPQPSIDKPFADYDNMFVAGFARNKIDWLWGMNLTRLYTSCFGVICSVGRVQTAVVNMIVQRDNDIANFTKKLFSN